MTWTAMVVAAAVAVAPTEAKKETGFDAMGVPLLSFNSDLGIGYGAVGGAYLYKAGYRPYQHGIALQTFFTTRGVQNHWLRYDGPQLIGRARVEARLEWRRELYSPYYGPGNLSAPGFEGEPGAADTQYAFDKMSPGAWIRIRNSPLGAGHPFQPYVGYGFRYNIHNTYPGSALEREKPLGLEGGPNGQVLAGAVWDTRDDEADPTSGGSEEIAVRLSGAATASRQTYAGVTLSERRFWALGTPKVVFGQRLAADFLMGQVPFFEWSTTGGLNYVEGIGGMSSVRGVPRNRYSGNIKLLSNSELRFYPAQFQLFDAPVKVGGLVFVDFGHAWHPGVEDGTFATWHPGAGAGLRLTRRAAVVRFDYAIAPETMRQAVYVAFGHMF